MATGNYILQTNSGQEIALASVTQLNADVVRINLTEPLADGSYQLIISAAISDLAGNSLTGERSFNFTITDPVGISEISPADGEEMVNLTRETIVRFDDPIDPTTVDTDSFYLIANGERVAGRVEVSSTERFATFFYAQPLNPSTEVRVVVDGNRIFGQDGLALDADGDGLPGGVGTADFRTLPLTRIPGTDVFGYIYDSFNQNPDGSNIPVVGATIRVDALPGVTAVTDENGYFILRDMPAPEFFVHIDGGTAINAPPGTTYATLGKPFHSVPGQSTQLNMNGTPFNIYLPPMAASDIEQLSATENTEVGFGEASKAQLRALFPDIDPSIWDLTQVTFSPGSARDDRGNAATQAAIIPVAPNRLPAPLPPNVAPQLVISIQAGGPKVTEDGKMIASDPGVGVVAPGWHFTISGTRARFSIGSSPQNNCGSGPDFLNADFPIQNNTGEWKDRPPVLHEQLQLLDRNLPTSVLEGAFRAGLFALGTGSLGQQFVDRFMAGTGGTLTHDVGSEISNL